jgi:long-chain acyl-CoA synthetase
MQETAQTRYEDFLKLQYLPQVLTHHLGRHDDLPAVTQYIASEKSWKTLTYKELHERVQRWERSFAKMNLERGSRVAMLMPNCIDAICFDQAALSRALVPVPLHAIDTPGSSAFILNDSEARVLVTTKYLKWKGIRDADTLPNLKAVIITDDTVPEDDRVNNGSVNVVTLADWLDAADNVTIPEIELNHEDLAALVYTSGTTGRPKGVMLTHENILENAKGVMGNIRPNPGDVWFSFLPLSHTFERTTTYYLAMGMGNHIWFNRNILQIVDDLRQARPTILMSVPRIYERIYARLNDKLNKQGAAAKYVFNWAVEVGWRRFCRENGLPVEHSWRECLDGLVADWLDRKVGSALRDVFGGVKPHAFISGGAALNQNVARTFIGLGIEIFQGYGLTETSPILAVNKEQHNNPSTVGMPLPNMQLRIGDNDELQVKGPCVMKGYWNRPEATRETFTEDGWLKTGDQADILPSGHVRIKGRIKEIIVTSTGEKIPPADLEMAIETDPLFAQVMAVGEAMPYVSAIVVLEPDHWTALAKECGVDPQDPASLTAKPVTTNVLRRIKKLTRGFPQYGVPRAVILSLDAWTIENGMLTPTLKLKRHVIRAHFQDQIAHLYESHPGA